MGTSLPRRDSALCAAHLTGRLMPLAIDRIGARLDGLHLSVAMGGLSQSQIDTFPAGGDGLVRRRAGRLYHWLFSRCIG